MTSLISKILKVSGDSASLLDSDEKLEIIHTPIYALNTLMSGELNGGYPSGLNIFAGVSGSFKTMFSLLLVKSYLVQYPDSFCVFYDTEGGVMDEYWKAFRIPRDRVIVIEPESITWLKNHAMKVIGEVEKEGGKLIFLWDSIGNTPSNKEIEDAAAGKLNTDMGARAKELKSLFRAVGPSLKRSGLTMVAVNHVYDSMDMYGKRKMSGGHGPMFMAHNVVFLSSSQLKDGKKVIGNTFTLRVEKGRLVRAGSTLSIDLPYGGKLSKYTGLFDIAMNVGVIEMSGKGWYSYKLWDKDGNVIFESEGNMRKGDFGPDVWEKLLSYQEFHDIVSERYKLDTDELIDFDGENLDGGEEDV